MTDVATTEQLLRIIQSIPSPKAAQQKLWLAQNGRESIGETMDSEKIAERLVATYERRGYTREWFFRKLITRGRPSGFYRAACLMQRFRDFRIFPSP